MKNKRWETYEQVAEYLLNLIRQEVGLSAVEGKQKLVGRSGVEWEVDAKGITEDGDGIIIVECRQYETSRQNQEKIAALAYRIQDVGAEGGIIVSPLGLQQGANRLAKATNIISVEIDANSTPTDFAMKFLNKLFIGKSFHATLNLSAELTISRNCRNCGEFFIVHDDEKLCEKCRNASVENN